MSSPDSRRLIERRVTAVAEARIADTPVVVLQGPRSVGKSTVLRELARKVGARVVNLDDGATRAVVAQDPSFFVAGSGPVFIDEYQRVPGLLDAIKVEVDRGYRPGRFVLAGSTRFDALPAYAQSLTGRLHLLAILPFSQGELAGVHEDFVEVALTEPERLASRQATGMTRAEYTQRICAGGLPIPLGRTGRSRTQWFDDYTGLSLRRDATGVSRIQRDAQLPGLLARLAGQSAQMLNIAAAGRAVDLDRVTANSYVTLLEDLFLIRRLPAWARTLRARAAALPKVHLVDTGIAARLLRLTPERLAEPDPVSMTEFGHLLETFVVNELLKQASWSDLVGGFGHWRTHDGAEVDLIIERDDGRVVAFEVKAGRQHNRKDIRGLLTLRDGLGDRFAAGVLLTMSETAGPLGDRISAVPIDQLWRPAG